MWIAHLKQISVFLFVYFMFPLWQSGAAQEDESLVLTFKKHKGPVYAIAIKSRWKNHCQQRRGPAGPSMG